uniref:NADH-ubiquinone oxidoreductase chain 2 n=1 Tax=Trinorchestia longiramus TaxID=1923959 RepID=A0A385UKU1_9CRUS|nr:NADH dehydrogenase subunit 2 [Trinorchestia longiramus]AYB71588.1 NADH dehydrogenase subunit 2 [Trinorchestia longiramus]
MLLHPSFFLFFFFLITSILILTSSSSWFVCWIALEINMLAFIPLILKKKNKYTAESALKYFLVQAIASMLIIISMTMVNNNNTDSILNMLMTASLLLKVACAPFHQWAPALVEGFTWPTTMIFLTLQKINPLILITMNPMTYYMNNQIIFVSIIASAFFGCIGGLNQMAVRKLMVYSSISHLAWLMSTIYISSPLWLMYFLLYSLILMSVMNIMNNMEVYSINHLIMKQKNSPFNMSVCLFSLGGLPPLGGFLPKLMTTIMLLEQSLIFMMFFLLSSALLSLFFYMRMILTTTLLYKSYKMMFYFNRSKKEMINTINIILLLSPMIFLII